MKMDPVALQEIQRKLEAGYAALDRHQPAAACRSWEGAWLQACAVAGIRLPPTAGASVLNSLQGRTSLAWTDLTHAWPGRQSLAGWTLDFDLALNDAAQEDPAMNQVRADICRQILTVGPPLTPIQAHRLMRSLAIACYLQGDKDAGDAVFTAGLNQQPGWTWGWISWADQYWTHPGRACYDPGQAEQILRRGLAVPDQDDRRQLLQRLRDFYTATGRPDQANAVR